MASCLFKDGNKVQPQEYANEVGVRRLLRRIGDDGGTLNVVQDVKGGLKVTGHESLVKGGLDGTGVGSGGHADDGN